MLLMSQEFGFKSEKCSPVNWPSVWHQLPFLIIILPAKVNWKLAIEGLSHISAGVYTGYQARGLFHM